MEKQYKVIEIEGFENYKISTDGEVVNIRTGHVLSHSTKCYGGYDTVSLYDKKIGKYVTARVHRLVARTFIPNPENLAEVDHINHDKYDNRVENLRWISRRDNLLNRDWCKPVVMCEKKTGKYITTFDTTIDAAEFIETTLGKEKYSAQVAISQCCNKLAHRHTAYGYKWEFLRDFSFNAERDYLDECEELKNGKN